MTNHDAEIKIAVSRMQPVVEEFAAALNEMARQMAAAARLWMKEMQDAFWPLFQHLAVEHEIEAGWQPSAARFRIRFLLERDEVIALAQRYMEDHKDGFEERE